MSISDLILFLGNLAEFFTLICCMDVFSSVTHTKKYKLEFVVSLFAYIFISLFIYIFNINQYIGFLPVLLYIAKFAVVIIILYNKKIFTALYATLMIDFLMSFLSSSVLVI